MDADLQMLPGAERTAEYSRRLKARQEEVGEEKRRRGEVVHRHLGVAADLFAQRADLKPI